MDINGKAKDLCEKLANSFYDRGMRSDQGSFFTKIEVEVIEEWIGDLIYEANIVVSEH